MRDLTTIGILADEDIFRPNPIFQGRNNIVVTLRP